MKYLFLIVLLGTPFLVQSRPQEDESIYYWIHCKFGDYPKDLLWVEATPNLDDDNDLVNGSVNWIMKDCCKFKYAKKAELFEDYFGYTAAGNHVEQSMTYLRTYRCRK